MAGFRSTRLWETTHALSLLTFALCVVIGEAIYESCAGKTLLKSGPLSCQDRQVILDTHNKLRQSIALGRIAGQPGATNMLEMVWDDELASVAQRWANRCAMSHDGARDVARFQVGQNIAASWSTREHSAGAPDFNRRINGWFNEVRGFNFYRSGISHSTGHYSQLVWADTYLVGCGYSYFFDSTLGYTKLYICNYGPAGNVIGAHPYNTGNPSCSTQGLNPSTRYHGLCEVHGGYPLGTCSSSGYPTGFSDHTSVHSGYVGHNAIHNAVHTAYRAAQSVFHPVQTVYRPLQTAYNAFHTAAQSGAFNAASPNAAYSISHTAAASNPVAYYASIHNVAAYSNYNYKQQQQPYTYHK